MVRASRSPPKKKKIATAVSVGVAEDDNKGSKLRRRRKESQVRAVVIVFAMIAFTFLVYVVKLNHRDHNKYVPSKLRHHRGLGGGSSSSSSSGQQQQQQVVVPNSDNILPLPSNSIYNKLLIPDITGNYISMDKYRGMVTLIVNVACL